MSAQLQVTGEAKIRDLQGPVVSNSGVISALDGAASQYVRGDGTLADFPTSSGGGSSVSYYLNSSVSQGTIGGVAYRELSKEPIIGAGTDIAIAANGYVASYITDVNDPDVVLIPGGNFNCEFYFSVNNNTGNPFFYAELYKYDGTTFTLLGSSVAVPEYITQGTVINPYYFAIPVATANLALTDRLAIRIYVNVDGRTVTLHTENGHLCQVVTTLSKGMVSLNNLTDQSQFLTTGTSGTNFAIVSTGDTHTFNLPIASATNTGKLSSTDWSTFNAKQATISLTTTGTSGAATLVGATLNIPQYQGVLTNPVTGTGTTNTLPKFTGASTIGNSNITDTGSLITLGSNSLVNGNVGIGSSAALATTNLFISRAITGGVNAWAVYGSGTIQSDVTAHAQIFRSDPLIAASAFTLNQLSHFNTNGTTLGAGSSVTNQYGFFVNANFIQATNNYGFRGLIPSGTNRWNLFMDGTAANYLAGQLLIGTTSTASGYSLELQNSNGDALARFKDSDSAHNGIVIAGDANAGWVGNAGRLASEGIYYQNSINALRIFTNSTERMRIDNVGSVGIGSTSLGGFSLRVAKNITGSTSGIGISQGGVIQSDVTSGWGYYNSLSTAAATFTIGTYRHYFTEQGTLGAGSVITIQTGFEAGSSLIGGTNNYGFRGAIPAGTNRWNLFMDGTANNYMAGSLGIGTTSLSSSSLVVARTLTGGTTRYGIYQAGQVQSDVTTLAIGLYNQLSTAAAAFTLPSYVHLLLQQGTIGATSSVTDQFGIFIDSTMTGATNNYGIYSSLAAGANRWNLYFAGSANNYIAGSLGIGSTSLTARSLVVSKNITGSTTSIGILQDGVIQSDVVTQAIYNQTEAKTAAAAFTLTNIYHYLATQGTFGAGSSVTNQAGFWAGGNLTGATNNFGFYGNIPSGTNRWNLYMNGTAANYMAGTLSIGGTTINSNTLLQINANENAPRLIVISNPNSGISSQAGLQLTSETGTASFNAYSSTFGTPDLQSSSLLSSGVLANGLVITTATTSPIRLRTNSIERVRIKQTGQMRFVPLASDPSGAEAGDVYYNSTTNALKLYDGTVWRTITVV